MIALALAVPVAAVAIAFGGVAQRGTSTSTTMALTSPTSTAPASVDGQWNRDLEVALSPLSGALTRLAAGVDRWSNGDLDDDGLSELLAEVKPLVRRVRSNVAALPRHPLEPLATPLVEAMAELYVRSVEAHTAALAASDTDVATQYDRLGRRLRILADRTFDRARERTAAPVDPGADVRYVLPAEVPDWTRLELAVGPPLDVSSDRTDDPPLERRDERLTQPEVDWHADVMSLRAPTPSAVRTAFGDAERLGVMASALVAAAEKMRDIPVPDGDRGRADRVALGWLIAADAARAAQLAAISGIDGVALADALVTIVSGDAFATG